MRQFSSVAFLAAVAALAVIAEDWMVYAIMASAILGILFLLDAFLFQGELYNFPEEPWVISAIFQGAAWLVAVVIAPKEIGSLLAQDPIVLGLGFASGMLNVFSFTFYYQAMQIKSDGAVMAIMWNLLIAVVPMLYFATGQRLEGVEYVGIALLLMGAMLASFDKDNINYTVVGLMLAAVIIQAVSIIAMEEAFSLMEEAGIPKDERFWKGFLPFTLGELLLGVVGYMTITRKQRAHLKSFVKNFWWLALLMEGCQLLAEAFSNKALAVGDASLVAAADGLMGAFTIAFSIAAVAIISRFPLRQFLDLINKIRRQEGLEKINSLLILAEELQEEHLSNIRLKLLGVALVTVGAYLVGG